MSTVFYWGQCGTFITTFPYSTDFETGTTWLSGGTNNDWDWGTPNHPIISGAASGTKAWCLGGLSGSAYNASQLSYIQSPCFDFTNLDYPWISFNIFWETEYIYDGVVLQYSINGGTSWANVGAFNEPVNCLNQNWYNHYYINWLTAANPRHGWTGRTGSTSGSCQGGNGSLDWVNATHCMSNLANLPSVRFRFLFGSGTTCNAFDGVAIDDILIQNAPPNTADFSHTCINANTLQFNDLSNSCTVGYSWNFGDPNSGNSNISAQVNPTHTFSAPGTYTVTLTANGPCNAPGVMTKTITILSPDLISTNVSCFGGSNGSATVTTIGTGPLTYAWDTSPIQQSSTISGLSPGTYNVTISDPIACSISASVIIDQPTPLTVNTFSEASCQEICNGSISATASGGTAPYTYSWSSLGGGSSFTNSVCSGNYQVTITDANNCTLTDNLLVDTLAVPIISCDSKIICQGGSATLEATGANIYSWSPAAGLSSTSGGIVIANPNSTTNYLITGTSVDGCSGYTFAEVEVNNVVSPEADFQFSPTYPNVYDTEVDFQNLSVNSDYSYWVFNRIDTVFSNAALYNFPSTGPGIYEVCLISSNDIGCEDIYCESIIVEGISTIFVPNSFTPNADGNNDFFKAVLRDISEVDFSIYIFDKWGHIIFQTDNIDEHWDGSFKGTPCVNGVYVWKIEYKTLISNVFERKMGTVSIIR